MLQSKRVLHTAPSQAATQRTPNGYQSVLEFISCFLTIFFYRVKYCCVSCEHISIQINYFIYLIFIIFVMFISFAYYF